MENMRTGPNTIERGQSFTNSQIIALYSVYRLILFVLTLGPLFILASPLLYNVAFYLLDAITQQNTIITMVVAGALTRWIHDMIKKYAPNERQALESAEKVQGWLPLSMLLLSILISWRIVTPLERFLGINTFFRWSLPKLSMSTALKLSVGALLLGCSVCARFVGPSSIVRCSSSPLCMNPTKATFLSLISNPQSLLLTAAMPSQASIKPQVLFRELPPRRLQSPTFAAAFAQIAMHCVISFAVAFTSVLPFTRDGTYGDSPLKRAIIMISCISTLFNLFQTLLDGSHEINPIRYRAHTTWMQTIKTYLAETSFSLLSLFAAVTIVALSASSDLTDVLLCYLTSITVVLYLVVFDYTLRFFLCATPPDIRILIEESSGDGSCELFVDVVLQCFCHSNDDLVKTLCHVPRTVTWVNLEKEELVRNEAAMSLMSKTLLYETVVDEHGPPLEEDILRLQLATSIGCWVAGSETNQWEKLSQPCSVPMCRALFAYFGGLGGALTLIAAQHQSTTRAWSIPPGTLVVSEWAVRGVTHCICSAVSVINMTTWRSSHIASLIPAVLASLHRLEDGMVKYAQVVVGIKVSPVRESEKMRLFQSSCPQLLSLYDVVNVCTKDLLHSISDERRRLDAFVSCDREIMQWCDAKMEVGENSQ